MVRQAFHDGDDHARSAGRQWLAEPKPVLTQSGTPAGPRSLSSRAWPEAFRRSDLHRGPERFGSSRFHTRSRGQTGCARQVTGAVQRDLVVCSTPEQRAVVVLHHHHGFPLTELAEILGIPVGTARSRLHYAVRQLRAALDTDAPSMAPPQERLA